MISQTHYLLHQLQKYRSRVPQVTELCAHGRLVRMVGLTLEAVGCRAPVGSKCLVSANSGPDITAEVVGFSDDKLLLMTTESTRGLSSGAKITPLHKVVEVGVSKKLLGRVIDGTGRALDDQGVIAIDHYYPLYGKPMNPLHRKTICDPLDVGVRSLNALTTIGRGQRMGLFAEAGIGKSMLLGMMTRFTNADVVVVGLVGERGREVKEFIEDCLGEVGLQKSVVVAAPADTSPLVRLHAALRATSIAEYFRDQGNHVLLLMDSLTRFAHAQRELALSIGEPPATKGYPPSVFAKLSQLVERAGNADRSDRSITAFYTVLAEGEGVVDPIADAVRSYLDGHIILQKSLADQGIYPAVDIESAISRVMHIVAKAPHLKLANRFKQLYSRYQQSRDLIRVGAYQSGSDPALDLAINAMPKLLQFLQQPFDQPVDYANSLAQLQDLIQQIEQQ